MIKSRASLTVLVGLLGGIAGVVACSSSDSTPSNSTSSSSSSSTSSGASGTSGTTAGNLTGNCATLKNCCPTLTDSSQQQGCNYAADNSQNNDGVCSDALKSYPTCGGGGGTSTSSSSSSGSSGCGPAGADPVAMPAECQALAGACIFHENATVQHGAQIVCMQFSGQYSQIASSAETQCTQGNAQHEWQAGKTCAQVVTGIQAGCENHVSGSSLCTTSYYGQGCVTGGGTICNSETSTNGVWVQP